MEDRVEEDPVLLGVGDGRRFARPLADRANRVESSAIPTCAPAGSVARSAREREAVAEQQVVRRRGGERVVGVAGGVRSDAVALVATT